MPRKSSPKPAPEPDAALRLAQRLDAVRNELCTLVATQHLSQIPELAETLRNLVGDTPTERMRVVAVDKLHAIVIATLTVGVDSIADGEYRWSEGLLPRQGVRQRHHLALLQHYLVAAQALNLPDDEQRCLQQTATTIAAIIRTRYSDM